MSNQVTKAELQEMSLDQLTALFNKITGSSLKKFPDKASGMARILKAQTAQVEQAGKAATVRGGKAEGGSSREIDFPAGKTKKSPREGSKRDLILGALRKGACTLDKLSEASGVDKERLREALRILNRDYGHGFRTRDDGKIELL